MLCEKKKKQTKKETTEKSNLLFLNFGGCSAPGLPVLLEQLLKSKCYIPNMLLYSTYLGKNSTKFQLFHIQYNPSLELCNELTIIIVDFQMESFIP